MCAKDPAELIVRTLRGLTKRGSGGEAASSGGSLVIVAVRIQALLAPPPQYKRALEYLSRYGIR